MKSTGDVGFPECLRQFAVRRDQHITGNSSILQKVNRLQ